jgi:phospholipase D-like protein/putative oligomerization/nucleic acid binding protein
MSLWDVMVSMFWFFVLFAWIWLLITILGDIFRDHELSGWGKAAWTLFLIVVPWLGALVYLIVRGRSMNERARAQVQRNEERSRQYIQEVAASNTVSTADELAKLADLRDRGAISDVDYEQAKSKVLS